MYRSVDNTSGRRVEQLDLPSVKVDERSLRTNTITIAGMTSHICRLKNMNHHCSPLYASEPLDESKPT